MYFPVGWPRALNLSIPGTKQILNHLACDAVKILLAGAGDDFLGIWYGNPLIPIAFHRRTRKSVHEHGFNQQVIWRPDSRQLAVVTSSGMLLVYQISYEDGTNILTQVDSPKINLQRESAELFIKENIPRLWLKEVLCLFFGVPVVTACCISLTELLLSTERCDIVKIQWVELNETFRCNNRTHSPGTINLQNIPFYVNKNCNLKLSSPIVGNSYVIVLEYSPFIGGCAAIFNDCRAAFLIINHVGFDINNVHGIWLPDIEDATCCSMNHKFRLVAYGRRSSEVVIFSVEDSTGELEFSHKLSLLGNASDTLKDVVELKWSPDGCVIAVAWGNGGLSLWSTFGTLLMSSLTWDYGINTDQMHCNSLFVSQLEWSTEGYQLFIIPKIEVYSKTFTCNALLLNFVKSALTMNPWMASHSNVLLQGDNSLYLNQDNNLEKVYIGSKFVFPNQYCENLDSIENLRDSIEIKSVVDISNILSENKCWSILQLPVTYAATNWPVRYSAMDSEGVHLAVAGRTGFVHYSIVTKKWKMFGNELQEKDFVVSGGLLWWKGFIIMGCYSLPDSTDEIRCYPEEYKLDNEFGTKIQVRAPIISLNMFQNQLVVLTADGLVSLIMLKKSSACQLKSETIFDVDIQNICIHPACIISLMVTNLRNDVTSKSISTDCAETIILNVCGRILMIHCDETTSDINPLMTSCLASCVECFWLSNDSVKSSISECLWLYGAHGMRVWLPILPPVNKKITDTTPRLHTFMSKRIMLSFPLKLYPLAISFDNAFVLGVENETTLYSSESDSHFSLPFCLLLRKSQVYLHKILRQLIKRNLGYSAWEIAKTFRLLPYFPHSLELLLHEVLEEEATSKEPIPDALLPSILDFIREFPVYLKTIVQCARKTEIALWPYLFSMAGKPKNLFQQCLENRDLETAASYLIILQNLEPSLISKQFAVLLLDIALENRKWDLSKDLIRFLKAIDPNEIDSPRSSMIINTKFGPSIQPQTQVNQNHEVFSLVLGPIARERSFSMTANSTFGTWEKKDKLGITSTTPTPNLTALTSVPNEFSLSSLQTNTIGQVTFRQLTESNRFSSRRKTETFCIETIIQNHARKFLVKYKLMDLGYMSAYLDFHLVSWLSQETKGSAKLDDFYLALIILHRELHLPLLSTCFGDMEIKNALSHIQEDFFIADTKFLETSSQTSESGYQSFSQVDATTSKSYRIASTIDASINENEEMQYSLYPTTSQKFNIHNAARSNSTVSLNNSQSHTFFSPENDISPMAWGNDNMESVGVRKMSEKICIKIRYLLQLFIEANCTDYALVLSILLRDAACVGRIINVVIRTESLSTCKRIEWSLTRLTKLLNGENLYQPLLISVQPHLVLLNEYISTFNLTRGEVYNDLSEKESIIDKKNHGILNNKVHPSRNCADPTSCVDGPKNSRKKHTDKKNISSSSALYWGSSLSRDHIYHKEQGLCRLM